MRNKKRSKRKKERTRLKARPKNWSKLKRLPINRCLICGHLLEHTRRQLEINPFCWECRYEAWQKGMSPWKFLKKKQEEKKKLEKKVVEEMAEFEARAEEKRELADKIDEMLERVKTTKLPCSFQKDLLGKQRELEEWAPPSLVCLYDPGEIKRLPPGRNRFWVNFFLKLKKAWFF